MAETDKQWLFRLAEYGIWNVQNGVAPYSMRTKYNYIRMKFMGIIVEDDVNRADNRMYYIGLPDTAPDGAQSCVKGEGKGEAYKIQKGTGWLSGSSTIFTETNAHSNKGIFFPGKKCQVKCEGGERFTGDNLPDILETDACPSAYVHGTSNYGVWSGTFLTAYVIE